MRGFTLLELLVVLFIITSVTFMAFPSFWSGVVRDDKVTIAAALKNLRDEAVSTKKEVFFTVDFKGRQFRFTDSKGGAKEDQKTIDMKDDETWEVFLPSRGTIKEGELIVAFTPMVQEELIALYLAKGGKESTILLNYLSGEVEIEDGKKKFDE